MGLEPTKLTIANGSVVNRVSADIDTNGRMSPCSLTWTDGRVFRISTNNNHSRVERIYVKVSTVIDADGSLQPCSITWKDGRVFRISEIIRSDAGKTVRLLLRTG